MMEDHIRRLRGAESHWMHSKIVVYVERNLGFEAEEPIT
jgi:hypothetical protein